VVGSLGAGARINRQVDVVDASAGHHALEELAGASILKQQRRPE
jgi:hypothetical protein